MPGVSWAERIGVIVESVAIFYPPSNIISGGHDKIEYEDLKEKEKPP